MFVPGCLPPYEKVCVCLFVRAYVPECIVYACKHASDREGVFVSPYVRLFVCLSVCVHICFSKCLVVHACVHQCMRSCVCIHTCVRAYVSVRPSLCPSVRPRTYSCVQMFVCICVRFVNACAIFLIFNFSQGSPGVGRNTFLSSPHLCFIIVFICDLFVSRDDPLMS